MSLKSKGKVVDLYGLRTKQTLESIKNLQEKLNLSSSESDSENLDIKKRNVKLNSDAVLKVKNPKRTKIGGRKKGNLLKTDNSCITLDDDDFVSVSNAKNEKVIADNSVMTIDDEENNCLSTPTAVTNSVITLDDSESFNIGSECIAVLSESESIQTLQSYSNNNEKQPLRRSKRTRKTTNNSKDVNETINDVLAQSTPRRGRRRKSAQNAVPVVTLDEDYPIPQCSYILPKELSSTTQSGRDDANKSINYDSGNETVSVFVSWRAKAFEKFELSRYRPLKSVFEHYAEKENIPVTCVLLMKDSDLLTPKDTPDSLNFKCVQFLQGFKATVEQNFEDKIAKPVTVNKEEVQLKVLLKNKRPLILTVKKNQSMKVIVAKCAGQLECEEKDVVLFVDGEKIDPKETPEDLDLDNGECVEAHIKEV